MVENRIVGVRSPAYAGPLARGPTPEDCNVAQNRELQNHRGAPTSPKAEEPIPDATRSCSRRERDREGV